MDFVKDLMGFLISRRKYWLAPIIIILLLLGLLMVLSAGSALAPFIYSVF